MTDPDSHRGADERNAALRAQVDEMLTQLRSRTEGLRQARATTAAVTGSAASGDGRVVATVDLSGGLSELRLAPDAFERTAPHQLAAAITEVVRSATERARAQLAAALEPVLRDGADRMDLLELVYPDRTDSTPSIRSVADGSSDGYDGPARSYLREA